MYLSWILSQTALTKEQVLSKIAQKYEKYTDIFSPDLVIKFQEITKINKYVIELVEGKQLLYRSIFSLRLVKLETFKPYIETEFKTVFIWLSKLLSRAFILFDKKLNGNLQLCINYRDQNTLTIKNRYILLLSDKSLGQLDQTKYFTQFDLTNAYH